MTDDNKKQPYQDSTENQDKQKGGQATATDQDLKDLGDDTKMPTETTELDEETTTTHTEEDKI